MEIVGQIQASSGVEIFGQTRSLVATALTIGALAMLITAFIDALRAPAPAFESAGKLTKNIWLIILGVAAAATFAIFDVLNILGIIAVVAGAVYLVDVRPAVRAAGGGRKRGPNEGPYGPW
jgi:hypothetical protein